MNETPRWFRIYLVITILATGWRRTSRSKAANTIHLILFFYLLNYRTAPNDTQQLPNDHI